MLALSLTECRLFYKIMPNMHNDVVWALFTQGIEVSNAQAKTQHVSQHLPPKPASYTAGEPVLLSNLAQGKASIPLGGKMGAADEVKDKSNIPATGRESSTLGLGTGGEVRDSRPVGAPASD